MQWPASHSGCGSQVQLNPHVRSLVADGLLRPGGDLHPVRLWDNGIERLLTETFRRLVLDALVVAERLTKGSRDRLLEFRHGGGFSVYGRQLSLNEEPARLEHMACY